MNRLCVGHKHVFLPGERADLPVKIPKRMPRLLGGARVDSTVESTNTPPKRTGTEYISK